LQAVGIPVLKGRAFGTQDNVAAPNRVLVSKSLADDLFPNADAIGQQIRTGGRVREIIGVVGDVAVDNEGRPQWYVYHAHRQFAGDRNWALTQVIALRDPHQTLQPAIRRLLSSLDPELVMYKPMMLDDVIGNGAAQRVFTLRILMAFAAVALGLAALGLFGVLSYGVRLRAREFSIRMALGAEQGSIRGMILRQGLTVTAIGLAIGIAGALLLSRFMASVLFKVSPLDPFVLGGAVVLMSVVGGLAAYVPAHRATASDPRAALQ
jgi:putative ABC transport system permease protein